MTRPPFDIASSRIPHLPPNKLQVGIRELRWCRDELANFDILSVHDRADPRIDALEAAIDDALLALFDRKSPEFQRFRRESLVDNACFSLAYPTPIHEIRQGLRTGLDDELERLDDAIAALESGLMIAGVDPEPPPPHEPAEPSFTPDTPEVPLAPRTTAASGMRTVYVVASRNDAAKTQLVDFLASVDLEPVVLDCGGDAVRSGSPSADEIRRAGFAVVLVTPDDIRTLNDPQTAPAFRPCPAQDVVFKLGFFVGAIGPKRVCALLLDEVEFPLDNSDVAAAIMDAAEGWKLVLAKKIKSAGVSIDLNRAI